MKKLGANIKENYKLLISVFVVGLFLGWFFFHHSSEASPPVSGQETHENHNHESMAPTIWTCSMHPQIKQDKPGLCPICAMDLIPLTSMDSGGDGVHPNEIVMSENAMKLASVQTIMVKKGIPEKTVYLQGKVQADERNMAELTARFGGRIEKLFINFTGQYVKKGEKLATIYSPGLVTAQRELLEAVSFKESRPTLYLAAKGKLKLWDLTDKQIAAIEEKGEPQVFFDVLSPISGTVSKRHVTIGDYVKEGSALFEVIDLTKVWVMFDAYESDLPWIEMGDEVNITIQALPGKLFMAKVSYIDPFLNAATRIVKVRVELANKTKDLKPEMFAVGMLESKIAEGMDQILIPKTAFLWTGKRAVVYVKVTERETPTFTYREVVLGPEAGAFYVVEEGLEVGEEIATNGVFKIDAASQLQGLPSMMNPDGGAGSTPNDMSKMDMGGDQKSNSDKAHKSMSNVDRAINTDPVFIQQLTDVYVIYLKMKDAFVATDAKKVSEEAQKVGKSLNSVDMGLLKGDAHMDWMDQLETLNSSINTISQTSDIKKQRLAFATFNLAFYKSLKMFGLKNDTAYYQYCPMANGDKGAYWFSETKEIRNPYFGDEMLGCGETRETFK